VRYRGIDTAIARVRDQVSDRLAGMFPAAGVCERPAMTIMSAPLAAVRRQFPFNNPAFSYRSSSCPRNVLIA
jgi:hypothetical protein